MKKEIWLPIAGFEGLYEVSNWGRVKSLARICKCRGGWRTVPERFLTQRKDRGGYKYTMLTKNGKSYTKKIHTLVWDTFVGTDRTGLQVNHIDENKENNCLWNLNLLTCKENINYGTHNERVAKAQRNHPDKSKPVIAQDPTTLKVVYEFPSAHEAERSGGFNRSCVCNCCNDRAKTHMGLIWRWAT